MKKLILLVALIVAGCAASPENLKTVAVSEASRLARPSKPLSSFATHELKPMTFSAEVAERPEKVEQGRILEAKIADKLRPLFAEWAAAPQAGRAGKLFVQPEVVKLRVVSGGARFFAGAWSGDSFIDLDLILTDDTGMQIARTRITRNASALGGAFSVGKTDQNLHDYMASIVHQYMVESY